MCLGEIDCWKLLAWSLISKSIYLPRNRVAPFGSHRCPQALFARLPLVSFNTADPEVYYLFHRFENRTHSLVLPLPISAPAILWTGMRTPQDEKVGRRDAWSSCSVVWLPLSGRDARIVNPDYPFPEPWSVLAAAGCACL